ncbi:unnamed protein product [Polarella glacialis]|uniref:Acyltransferase n=1 Tax=Polarella glacialis TaxID=89957 RepID=A0A813I0Y6_POLGL|nr:unnamed protein product [Polarella glacialis]
MEPSPVPVRVLRYPEPTPLRAALGWVSITLFHAGLFSIPLLCLALPLLVVFCDWRYLLPLAFVAFLSACPHRKWPAFERAWRPILELWCEIFRTTLIYEGHPAGHPSAAAAAGEKAPVVEDFILTVGPHGIIPISGFLIWGASQSHGLHPEYFGGADVALGLPFFRQFLVWSGGVSASKKVVEQLLSSGARSFSVFPGGISEMMATRNDCETLVLKPRKGIIGLAKKHGKAIVPVLTFGTTQHFQRWPPPDVAWVRWLSRRLRIALVVPRGRFWLPIPFYARATVVFGAPIATADKSVEELHEEWVNWFETTYERYKDAAGCAGRELLVL